jgi:hypothetical protein
MANVKFVASYTATVNANAKDVWAVWSDPSKWSSLDDGNVSAEGGRGLRAGSVVQLKLRSGQTVEVKLTNVTDGEAFSDETALPYGVVRTHHKLEQSGKNLIVSYAIEAQIAEESSDAFSKEFWPNLLEGIPHQVHNVAALAKMS